jgi:hypothetical protein
MGLGVIFLAEHIEGSPVFPHVARIVEPMLWYLESSTLENMRQWVEQQGLACTQVYDSFYFRSEQDRLLFMLRWSR